MEPHKYVKGGKCDVYGKWYEPDDLVDECLKDKPFYDGKIKQLEWKISGIEKLDDLPGRVIFSGREALLQMS